VSAPLETGPPVKRRAPGQRNPSAVSDVRLANGYLDAKGAQASFTAWQREAVRLASEYLRTGREIHRLAFERHVGGMLEHVYKHLRHKARSQGAVRN
jgi:hypothetical protein